MFKSFIHCPVELFSKVEHKRGIFEEYVHHKSIFAIIAHCFVLALVIFAKLKSKHFSFKGTVHPKGLHCLLSHFEFLM